MYAALPLLPFPLAASKTTKGLRPKTNRCQLSYAASPAKHRRKPLSHAATDAVNSSIAVLSPRLFSETSPSARASKGFLILQQVRTER
jgi:hypothetical protein